MVTIELTGQRFGRLAVLGRAPGRTGRPQAVWRCRCDCGSEVGVRSQDLRAGKTQSCGCLHRDRRADCRKTHGHTSGRRSPEYVAWRGMKTRCYNAKAIGYARYGARGIRVCGRWLDSFEAFFADMGPRPGPDFSIDRTDNDGDYEPGNCRWATRDEQLNNTSRNIVVEHRGKRMTLTQVARIESIDYGYLRRVHVQSGVPLHQAIEAVRVGRSI